MFTIFGPQGCSGFRVSDALGLQVYSGIGLLQVYVFLHGSFRKQAPPVSIDHKESDTPKL